MHNISTESFQVYENRDDISPSPLLNKDASGGVNSDARNDVDASHADAAVCVSRNGYVGMMAALVFLSAAAVIAAAVAGVFCRRVRNLVGKGDTGLFGGI